MTARPDATAFGLLFILGTIWGLTPALGKLGVEAGLPPLAYVVIQTALSTVWLVSVALLRGDRLPLDPVALRFHLGSGLLGFAAPNAIALVVLQHVPASLFAVIIPVAPLITLTLSAALGMERLTARRLAGVVLALAGTAIALAPGAVLPEGGSIWWALASLGTPGFYAVSTVFAVRYRPAGVPAIALAAGSTAGACLFLVPLAFLVGHSPVPAGRAGEAIAASQSLLGATAYLIYFRLLTHQGGIFASQVGYVMVLTGMAWGWIVFAERPGWLAVPAALLIFGGLALATLPGRGTARLPAPR